MGPWDVLQAIEVLVETFTFDAIDTGEVTSSALGLQAIAISIETVRLTRTDHDRLRPVGRANRPPTNLRVSVETRHEPSTRRGRGQLDEDAPPAHRKDAPAALGAPAGRVFLDPCTQMIG